MPGLASLFFLFFPCFNIRLSQRFQMFLACH